MSNKIISRRTDRAKAQYLKIFRYQSIALTLVVAGLAIVNWVWAYSALAGGAIYLIPNLYLVNRHFKREAAKSAQATLAELYAGQLWKMALMAVGFALAFVLIEPLSAFSLFVTLIVLQLGQILMQIRVKT